MDRIVMSQDKIDNYLRFTTILVERVRFFTNSQKSDDGSVTGIEMLFQQLTGVAINLAPTDKFTMKNSHKHWVIAFFGLAGSGALAVTWIVLGGPETAPIARYTAAVEEAETQTCMPRLEKTPSEILAARLKAQQTPKDRIALLDSLLGEVWAMSDLPALQECITFDAAPEVREHAFGVSLKLAEREGKEAKTGVISSGLQNVNSEVKRAALRASRDNPDAKHVSPLLKIADGNSGERHLAIDALAQLSDRAAQMKVLEAAKNSELPPVERARAISWLSRSNLPQASEYLKELVQGEDRALRKLAFSTLEAMQTYQAKPK
jgi:hypothetical protein